MSYIQEQNDVLGNVLRDLAETAGLLWSKGWAEGNAGNLSYNVTDVVSPGVFTPDNSLEIRKEITHAELSGQIFLITCMGARMRDLAQRPEEHSALIRIHENLKGYVLLQDGAERSQRPSSELSTHLEIHGFLKRSNSTKCVVLHTHPTELIALTHHAAFLNRKNINHLLRGMIPETALMVPEGVGVVPYRVPGSIELAMATTKQLQSNRMVLWEKHGCLAVGKTAQDAFDLVDVINKAAQIYVTSMQAGFEPDGIPQNQIDLIIRERSKSSGSDPGRA